VYEVVISFLYLKLLQIIEKTSYMTFFSFSKPYILSIRFDTQIIDKFRLNVFISNPKISVFRATDSYN
jgi:hypothetical protein